MRILAVTPYYEPEGGGLERYAHAILRRLAERGHEVEAIAFTDGATRSRIHDRVRVTRITPALRFGNTPLHPRLFWLLEKRIRAWRPDVVVAHAPVPFAAEMAFLAARRQRVPFVLTYHAGQLRGSSAALDLVANLDRATLQRQMIAQSAEVIGASDYVRLHALQARRHDAHIVSPGVDARLYAASPMPATPNVLFVGPLDSSYRWKGLDVLLDAFDVVRAQMPEATLTLVGRGNRLEEMRLRTAQSGGKVHVLGRLTDAALAREYQRCSVLVLPSTSDAEAFGMVLAEANASARPVIGSAIGGIPDFVKPGRNGLLAKPGDAADLGAKILEVLSDPADATRMGSTGRRHVVRHHDWDRLASTTEAILAKAAASKRPLRPNRLEVATARAASSRVVSARLP